MVRGKGVNPVTGLKRSMTMGELQDIQAQKAESEATLNYLNENPGATTSQPVDKVRLQKEIQRYDSIIHEGSPKEVRGINKDRLIKEADELRETLRKGMPTREEMDHPAKNPGAVAKHIGWNKRNRENIERYKDIMRQVEPNDPTATNYDNLRREK